MDKRWIKVPLVVVLGITISLVAGVRWIKVGQGFD